MLAYPLLFLDMGMAVAGRAALDIVVEQAVLLPLSCLQHSLSPIHYFLIALHRLMYLSLPLILQEMGSRIQHKSVAERHKSVAPET